MLARTLDFSPYQALVVVGGDGSIMEVISGLAPRPKEERIPVSILPGGSGNSFMADLGCWVITEAIDWLLESNVVSVDANHVKDEGGELDVYSINVVALGLIRDAATTAEDNRWLGSQRYNICGLWGLLKHHSENIRIEYVDNEDKKVIVEESMITAFVNHTQFFGKGLRAAPFAKMNDGLADLLFAFGTDRGKLLAIFQQLPIGAHYNNPNITMKQIKSCQFSLPNELNCVTIDGETFGCTGAVTVTCVPDVFELFCVQDTRPLSNPSTCKVRFYADSKQKQKYQALSKKYSVKSL